MNRYSVFSITGYGISPEGVTKARYGSRLAASHPNAPITTWYVADNDFCGEVIAAFPTEHEAKLFRFRANASERRWEKEQERAG